MSITSAMVDRTVTQQEYANLCEQAMNGTLQHPYFPMLVLTQVLSRGKNGDNRLVSLIYGPQPEIKVKYGLQPMPYGQTVKKMLAGETIYPGEAVFIDRDGLVRLTDREEAAKRAHLEEAIANQSIPMIAMRPLPKGSAIFDDGRIVGVTVRDIAAGDGFTRKRGKNTDDVHLVGRFIAPTTYLNTGKTWTPDTLPDESVIAQSPDNSDAQRS